MPFISGIENASLTRPPRIPYRSHATRLAHAIGMAALIAGCASIQTRVPVDIHQAGWSVRQGQATWTPRGGDQPMAGELMLATGPAKSVFVQFSKPPFDVAIARATGGSWQLEYPLQRKSLGGRASPPHDHIWFALARACANPTTSPEGWNMTRHADGRWKLTSRRTGEKLEGFFNP